MIALYAVSMLFAAVVVLVVVVVLSIAIALALTVVVCGAVHGVVRLTWRVKCMI